MVALQLRLDLYHLICVFYFSDLNDSPNVPRQLARLSSSPRQTLMYEKLINLYRNVLRVNIIFICFENNFAYISEKSILSISSSEFSLLANFNADAQGVCSEPFCLIESLLPPDTITECVLFCRCNIFCRLLGLYKQ